MYLVKPVSKDIYERLKAIEDRVLVLENIQKDLLDFSNDTILTNNPNDNYQSDTNNAVGINPNNNPGIYIFIYN